MNRCAGSVEAAVAGSERSVVALRLAGSAAAGSAVLPPPLVRRVPRIPAAVVAVAIT